MSCRTRELRCLDVERLLERGVSLKLVQRALRPERREQKDRGLDIPLAESTNQASAVEPRHREVGNDHVRSKPLVQELQRFDPVLSERSLKSVVDEHFADEHAQSGVIVDDQRQHA